eukprot:TRINITY_DN6404_c0_g1_i1.p1 TRINITY_DN6404_c0_g1~~TRINITY_DN6404_c0_g1_i1.p1  ORF type:complete len:412 (-),score=40.97 TRINITY_DN6404_c0_g1_i1:145-1380(-)
MKGSLRVLSHQASRVKRQLRIRPQKRANSTLSFKKGYYIWGSCDQGQLGLGREYDVQASPTFHEPLSAIQPKLLSVGMSHTLALGNDGKLYAWGANAEYQIGDGTTQERCEVAETSSLPRGTEPLQLIAGPHQSMAIVKEGYLKDVIAWGLVEENDSVDPKHFPEPARFPALKIYSDEIEKIVLSPSYSHYALLTSGDVLHFGKNLDPESPSFHSTPVPIQGLKSCLGKGEKILDIVGGWGHVVALTNACRVITWGSNMHGQTGHGEDAPKYASKPKVLDLANGTKVTAQRIIAGSTHTMIVGTNGELLVFGSHRDGKLGLGRELDKDIKMPVPLAALKGRKIRLAAAGCDHSAVVTEDNELFTWGFGQHGALGLGNLQDQFSPQRVSLPFEGQVEDIYCGMDLTMVSTYN